MKKIIPLLLIFSFIFCACSKKDNQKNETPIIEKDTLSTTYLEKPSIGKPKSQEPIDNIFIALSVLKTASFYESTSSGEVVAKKGSVKLATQKVENKKILTPSATFNESISVSTFVKVAEQLYITNDTTLKREANKVSNSNVSWKNSVTTLSTTQYLDEYGYSAKDPTRYIINEQSIISDIEIINNGIGRKFTYKFNLDPTIAPYFYKTSVKTLSGSSSFPQFKSIEMKLSFDYKWRITQIDITEKYEISLPALGSVTCYATLTENFSSVNKPVNIPEESFFEKNL